MYTLEVRYKEISALTDTEKMVAQLHPIDKGVSGHLILELPPDTPGIKTRNKYWVLSDEELVALVGETQPEESPAE